MRCRLCAERAGFARIRCASCKALWAVWQQNRGASWPRLFSAFAATGIARERIERFLDAEPRKGEGSIRDRVAADLANALLAALGQAPRQTAREVKRLRARGLWRSYDRPPEEGPFDR